MDKSALVVMLIVGAVAGWLASLVVGTLKWGLLGCILAGILGGVVGGWLLKVSNVRFNLGHPIANDIAISALGAVVVIILARILS